MILGTGFGVLMSIFAGYGLSRHLLFGGAIALFLTFTMMFNGGIIPTYMVVRSLGMLDTRAAIVLPTALSVFNIMITRTSFKSIPEGLMDAARIDGAGHIRILVSIVIPVSKAIIAVITLFSAVQIWNSWFHTAIYVRKRELYPLQIVLREIVLQNSTQASDAGEAANEMNLLHAIIRYCVIMLSIIPMLSCGCRGSCQRAEPAPCNYPLLRDYAVHYPDAVPVSVHPEVLCDRGYDRIHQGMS